MDDQITVDETPTTSPKAAIKRDSRRRNRSPNPLAQDALLERLASIDDDRRRTAATLQRAMHNHEQQVGKHLRRWAWLIIIAFLVLGLTAAAGAFVSYQLIAQERLALQQEIDDVKRELSAVASETAALADVGSKVAGLDEQVAQIAVTQKELESLRDQIQSPPTSADSGVEEIAGPDAADSTDITSEASTPSPPADAAAEVGVNTTGEAVPETTNTLVELEGFTIKTSARMFAVQLRGFEDLEALQSFATGGALPTNFYYLEESYSGSPWYVLIHSLHDQYAMAERTLSELPAGLVELGPWIRPLAKGTELHEMRE